MSLDATVVTGAWPVGLLLSLFAGTFFIAPAAVIDIVLMLISENPGCWAVATANENIARLVARTIFIDDFMMIIFRCRRLMMFNRQHLCNCWQDLDQGCRYKHRPLPYFHTLILSW